MLAEGMLIVAGVIVLTLILSSSVTITHERFGRFAAGALLMAITVALVGSALLLGGRS